MSTIQELRRRVGLTYGQCVAGTGLTASQIARLETIERDVSSWSPEDAAARDRVIAFLRSRLETLPTSRAWGPASVELPRIIREAIALDDAPEFCGPARLAMLADVLGESQARPVLGAVARVLARHLVRATNEARAFHDTPRVAALTELRSQLRWIGRGLP